MSALLRTTENTTGFQMSYQRSAGMKKIQKHVGVYYYESTTRRHNGKPDRCYYALYKRDGKLIKEKVGWSSEGYSAELASGIRSERIRSMRHGEELPGDRKEYTFGDAWKAYDKWLDSGKKWPDDDRSRYHRYLEGRFSGKRFDSISPIDLERLKSEMLKSGLAGATVKHVLVLFRQIWNKATVWKLTNLDNPVKSIRLPKFSNRRERFLSRGEAATLLCALRISSQTVYEMAALSLMTGMRAGEIHSLKWGDVDLENGTLSVPMESGTMKRGGRPIWLNKDVITLLLGKERGNPGELVFPSLAGNRRSKVQRSFRDVVNRIGLNAGATDRRDRVTFHTLRHTFASWLAMDGIPLFTIKELMGHSSIAMTERYSKLMPDTKRLAVSGLSLPRIPESTPAVVGSCNPQDQTART